MEIEYDIELSERKKMILKAIVEAHIKLGEPVGSKYLTQEMGISYSSATIRNEMAELEEMGFLVQPHTSAGRISSELGYRFYVDSLVQQYDMTTKEANELNNMLSVKMSEIDKILENARKAASAMTNYTALTLRQSPTNVTVKKYEVVFLESRNILLVMVTVNDSVKTRNIKLPFDVSREDTERLSFVLNDELSGIAIENINISLIVRMEERMESCPGIVNIVVKSIYEAVSEINSEIRFEGVNRLLQYPEYKNLDKLQQMISTIEDKNDIIRAISSIDQSDDETKIFIGSENMVKIMDNSTLIYKNLKLNGKTIGAIGIIGPCRMDYSRVLATIDKLSDEIGRLSETTHLLPDAESKKRDR